MSQTTRMRPCPQNRGFSLVELLTVIAVIAVLTAATGPALQALKSSGGVNRAIVESSRTLEYARTYAMSNHTYVRVAIGQVTATSTNSTPATVLVAIYSVDGTLDNDSATGMADTSKWRMLVKPVILDNLTISTTLTINKTLDAAEYVLPAQTDIAATSFKAGDRGSVSCPQFIQFGPDGGARVVRSEPARFIDLAIDRPSPKSNLNPFVLRVSGLNGSVAILRKGKGEGIQ